MIVYNFENMSLRINVPQILLFIGTYLFILDRINVKYKNRIYKHHQFVSNVMSNATCILFLYSGDINMLISYYWYDLIFMIWQKDILMILHHIITIYGISHSETHSDYNNMLIVLLRMKTGDVFMHYYKIIDSIKFNNEWQILAYFVQYTSVLITLLLWLIFRITFILGMFPFNTLKANMVVTSFTIVNIWWTCKMHILAKKIYRRICNEMRYF